MCLKTIVIAAFVQRGSRVESAIRTSGSAVFMFVLAASPSIVPAVAQEKNPELNAYFGDEHIHTSWSLDALVFDNSITGPDNAYQSPNP
jgi:hypothetical protein